MPAPAVRTFHHRDFDLGALLASKGATTVSVCLPARNEEATVGRIIEVVIRLVSRGLVNEVVVVDDGSTDATAMVAADAGARVVATSGLLPECGAGTGKGEALWKSLYASEGDLVVWCDADLRNFGPRFVVGLLGPLLMDEGIVFVKGCYRRAGQGGRVTELVARPLVSLLFPHLAPVAQPLSGECAGRRAVLERLPFVQGYGVDLALLIDVATQHGVSGIAQVDLGTRVHRNRPLEELSPQAMAVLQIAMQRADLPVALEVVERPPLVDVPAYCRRSA